MQTLWMVLAVAALFALAATLRLSLAVRPAPLANPVARFVTSPAWLVPYILVMGYALGQMIKGNLSPLPPVAFAETTALWGRWAGVTAFLVVLTVNLWLLWTAGMLARRFGPENPARAPWAVHVLAFVFGSLVLAALLLLAR